MILSAPHVISCIMCLVAGYEVLNEKLVFWIGDAL